MATITVRNLDDTVRDKLKQQAVAKGRSMEAYVRLLLKKSVNDKSQTAGRKAKAISKCFRGLDIDFKLPPREAMPTPIQL